MTNPDPPSPFCSWCGDKLTHSDSFVSYDGECYHNVPKIPDKVTCFDRELISRGENRSQAHAKCQFSTGS